MSKSQRRTQSQIPIDVRDRVQNSILNQKIHQTKYLRTQSPIQTGKPKAAKHILLITVLERFLAYFVGEVPVVNAEKKPSEMFIVHVKRQGLEEGDYASYTNWPRRGRVPGIRDACIRGSTHLQIGVNRKLKGKKLKVQDIGYSLQPVSRYCTYISKTCKSMCVIYATW